MCHYVFTNSMKRHERSALCLKLYHEIYKSQKLLHLITPLWKTIDSKIKAQNKFRPNKEPVFAITASTYKGISFYCIAYQSKNVEFIFKTSPIDAAYVEFTRVISNATTNTMVYTQHALDRYNERVHGKKYDNYNDMMKRLIVNNPVDHSRIIDEKHKIVMKVKEGFLSGTVDATHKMLIMNTFFDKVEYEDNKLQHRGRSDFDTLRSLTPAQQIMLNALRAKYKTGQLTLEELVEQFFIHGFPSDAQSKEINLKADQLLTK